MIYQVLTTNDIDQLFAEATDWESEYIQLTPGKLNFGSRLVQLEGLAVQLNSFRQRILCRDNCKSDDLFFGTVVNANTAVHFEGNPLRHHVGVIHHFGKQKRYVLDPGETLDVSVSPKLVNKLGWQLCDHVLHRVVPEHVRLLVNTCKEILHTLDSQSSLSSTAIRSMTNRVLTALDNTISPWKHETRDKTQWFEEKGTRSFSLVKSAEEIMLRLCPTKKLNVAELACEIGVSQRTIYESFNISLGVGPYEYHQILKLHSFRNALLVGEPFSGKISRDAKKIGFTHMGQLSRIYRRHFGESPSETIKRRTT